MSRAPDPARENSTRKPHAWPVGLLGMLALVAAVERSLARNDVMFSTVAASAWSLGGAHLKEASRSAVVCFGDSLIKDGLIPPVLEERHGLSAWNLALPKGPAPAHYFLLRRLIRSGARPSAVLIDGAVFTEDPLAETRVWPELADSAELADLALTGRDPTFLAQTLLARVLFSYRTRPDIRQCIVSAFWQETPPGTWNLTGAWRNWNTNRGAYVMNDRPATPGVDPDRLVVACAGQLMSGWNCHPVNDLYVRRFLDLAGSRAIPVFWLLPPTHPGIQAGSERLGGDARYTGYVRRLQESYPRLTVIDGRHAGYPPEALFDVVHLSRTGAISYTDAVGAVLRARIDAGASAPGLRWVELPRYSAAKAAALAAVSPVEDLDRSNLALKLRAKARR